LQDPSELNEDNLSNARWEDSRHYWNKKRKFLKDKLNELESSSENKNIRDLYRDITEFKKGYQPRSNFVKDERGVCQILNLHGVGGVRHTGMHTAEPFVPEFEVAIES
jgi:hypothetical protein